MLVKVNFTNKEYLVILEKNDFGEFVSKTKTILKLRTDISVEYSGCRINETLFLQLLTECARTKEPITFLISSEQEVGQEMATEEVHENAREPESVPEPPQEQQPSQETEEEPDPKRPRGPTVNHKIAAIKFDEIFEVAKLIGALKNGHVLTKNDRISAAKASIKRILCELGFDYKIQKPDFLFLSKKLETLLTDPEGVYYIPAKSGCPARGILFHEYYTARTDLAKKNIIRRRDKVKRVAIDVQLTAAGNSNYQNVVQMFEECEEDWAALEDLWMETRQTRLDIWQSNTSQLTIDDIYEDFSFLKDTRADKFILDDFNHLFPEAMATLEKWKTENFMKVLNKARNIRDDYARRLILWVDLSTRIEDKILLSLALIPYLMAPNGRKNSQKQPATKNSIQVSFINIFLTLEAMTESDDDLYVMRFLREDGELCLSTYDFYELEYKYKDCMEAFLTLFARLMVFNMKFPKSCNHVWQFIQKGVFGIPIEKADMCHVTMEALKNINF